MPLHRRDACATKYYFYDGNLISGGMAGNEAYPFANSNPAALTTRSRSSRGMGAAHS